MSVRRHEVTREGGLPNVVRAEDGVYTLSAAPGTTVCGERTVDIDGAEYRHWNPLRSKLAAFVMLGGSGLRLAEDSRVLYLGAASGTTASHVSDIASKGIVYCVEVSQRSFRDLLRVCESRPNMIPILADATGPHAYAHMIEGVDLVYQDIAQRAQVDIFADNLREFDAPHGLLMLKSRSVDVNRVPKEVYGSVRSRLSAKGLVVRSVVDLQRYSKDHAAFVVEGPG